MGVSYRASSSMCAFCRSVRREEESLLEESSRTSKRVRREPAHVPISNLFCAGVVVVCVNDELGRRADEATSGTWSSSSTTDCCSAAPAPVIVDADLRTAMVAELPWLCLSLNHEHTSAVLRTSQGLLKHPSKQQVLSCTLQTA